jgi:hypothetical protein
VTIAEALIELETSYAIDTNLVAVMRQTIYDLARDIIDRYDPIQDAYTDAVRTAETILDVGRRYGLGDGL